jgi:hypothetical protein
LQPGGEAVKDIAKSIEGYGTGESSTPQRSTPGGAAVFRRLFRVTLKLGLIALVGVGIAVVVKKMTAPADTAAPIEPWPPLPPEGAPSTQTNGETAAAESTASTS